jgi:hypothetical protein
MSRILCMKHLSCVKNNTVYTGSLVYRAYCNGRVKRTVRPNMLVFACYSYLQNVGSDERTHSFNMLYSNSSVCLHISLQVAYDINILIVISYLGFCHYVPGCSGD